MKGDYSRDTFDSRKHYTRVLMQQGRVQMDSDWNEQVANLLHYLHSLARDLIGQHGTPADTGQGFMIMIQPEAGHPERIADLMIGVGRYYVDGIMCEMDQPWSYYRQPDYPLDPAEQADRLPDAPFLLYLDVWERHITSIEDPQIRDVALGGADTAARAKVIWQVKALPWSRLDLPFEAAKVSCENWIMTQMIMSNLRWNLLTPGPWGELEARAKVPDDDDKQPCIISPEAKFRGAENQLYRVEIHRGGEAGGPYGATFKWSRENGSVVFPVRAVQGNTVTLDHLGRDERFGLEVGDWVELIDDATVLRGEISPLLQVVEIDRFDMAVRLSGNAPESIDGDQGKHPLLRRWDHQKGDPARNGLEIANDGAAAVVESATNWLNLEDGVQIRFSEPGGKYYSGAYWLITARTATGDVELRYQGDEPEENQLEHPGLHHYAPLAIILPNSNPPAGAPRFLVTDLRHFIRPAATCCPDIAVVNQPTAIVGQPISFGARVGNISSPVARDLIYRWKIEGATPATTTGTNISVSATAAGSVTATLTIEGLPLGCPATAKGICLAVQKNA